MVFVIHSFALERFADPQPPAEHCGRGYRGDSHGSSPREAHRVVRVTLLPAHLVVQYGKVVAEVWARGGGRPGREGTGYVSCQGNV